MLVVCTVISGVLYSSFSLHVHDRDSLLVAHRSGQEVALFPHVYIIISFLYSTASWDRAFIVDVQIRGGVLISGVVFVQYSTGCVVGPLSRSRGDVLLILLLLGII